MDSGFDLTSNKPVDQQSGTHAKKLVPTTPQPKDWIEIEFKSKLNDIPLNPPSLTPQTPLEADYCARQMAPALYELKAIENEKIIATQNLRQQFETNLIIIQEVIAKHCDQQNQATGENLPGQTKRTVINPHIAEHLLKVLTNIDPPAYQLLNHHSRLSRVDHHEMFWADAVARVTSIAIDRYLNAKNNDPKIQSQNKIIRIGQTPRKPKPIDPDKPQWEIRPGGFTEK